MKGPRQARQSIVVIGASGKTGVLVIKRLLAEGHFVRAVSRTPPAEFDDACTAQIEFMHGDVSKGDAAPWMIGMDAVVFTAAGDASTEDAVDHLGARRCANAAQGAGVARFILISAHGAHDPSSWGAKFQSYLVAKTAGEKAVRSAFPSATIIRPGILTDDPETGSATIRTSVGSGEVPVTRADVASLTAMCSTRQTPNGLTLEIVGGTEPIKEALQRTFNSLS